MGATDRRLQELGITLPAAAAPVANYLPFVRTGNLVVVSGQICFGPDGKIADAHKGKLGREVALEAGQAAARLSGALIAKDWPHWASSPGSWLNRTHNLSMRRLRRRWIWPIRPSSRPAPRSPVRRP